MKNLTFASNLCNQIQVYISDMSGGVYAMDTRTFASDFTPKEVILEEFFTISPYAHEISHHLHAKSFRLSSLKVSQALDKENLTSYVEDVELLLKKNLNVVIYAGEFDEKDGPATIEPWLKTVRFAKSKEFWEQARSVYWREGDHDNHVAG